jgi:two-component system, LytTR family, response regulator
MIRSIIIDDEINGAESLQLMLQKCCDGKIAIEAVCNSAKEGFEKILSLRPDLVFLDIQMPHMNGFELLAHLPQRDFQVIFTTAFDDYAIQAFKVNAIDYLLKPIDPDDLLQAVSKARKKIMTESGRNEQVDQLLRQIKQQRYEVKKLAIPGGDGVTFIELEDIPRIEADSNYTTIYTHAGKKYIVAKTLKEYEELLEDYNFLRIHSSTLINLRYVEKYIRGDGGFVMMKDGSQVEVSRRKKQELIDRLNL